MRPIALKVDIFVVSCIFPPFALTVMSISPELIVACAYVVIVPPMFVIRQMKYDKEAAERKNKLDEDIAKLVDEDMAKLDKAIQQVTSNNADAPIPLDAP